MKQIKVSDETLRGLSRTKTMSEIAEVVGLHYDTVRHRLKKLSVQSKGNSKKAKVISVEEELTKQKAKREDSLNARKVNVLMKNLESVTKERDAFLDIQSNGNIETYVIKNEKEEGVKTPATSITLSSDWHYEEPVKSSQVNGLNKYTREIAKERIEKFFIIAAKLIKVHQKEYEIKNHILALLGDFISGSIHEDLQESNEIQPTEAIWEVQALICSGIEYMLKNTDVNFIIPCSSGNHGRITAKSRVSTNFGNSIEILMYRNIEHYFRNEKRTKFIINDSYLTYVDIYGFTLRFHHGDSIRYGGGVGGIFIPAFKAINQWNKGKRADWDLFGHFHQLKDGGNFITNGSIIGYNAYAMRIKADYEKPKQAFLIIDKKRGMDVVRKITL